MTKRVQISTYWPSILITRTSLAPTPRMVWYGNRIPFLSRWRYGFVTVPWNRRSDQCLFDHKIMRWWTTDFRSQTFEATIAWRVDNFQVLQELTFFQMITLHWLLFTDVIPVVQLPPRPGPGRRFAPQGVPQRSWRCGSQKPWRHRAWDWQVVPPGFERRQCISPNERTATRRMKR